MKTAGKKRDASAEEDVMVDLDSPGGHKKHKKHKKHKHKKKKEAEDDSISEIVVDDPDVGFTTPPIKLKIKIGGQTLGTKSVIKEEGGPAAGLPWEGAPEPEFKVKNPDSDTSDEEKEWLKALEAGTLDDNGEVKKEKDPMLLTARQRALLQSEDIEKIAEPLMELPSGYKTTEMTEEQLERRLQRAKKRREQAQEKREKDKKQTLDRLLKKQEAKLKGAKCKSYRRNQLPMLRYLDNRSSISISVPEGIDFPYRRQTPKILRPRIRCGALGCHNEKKYSCSKTGVPLCSLACYKKNLAVKGL